jgi:phage shock protein PspC (stress-responsive transcriptional regulator)
MKKKLCKSRTDKKIAGVCGGIAQYTGIDSTIIRLALVLLVLCAGCGILAYIIAALVLPDEEEIVSISETNEENK